MKMMAHMDGNGSVIRELINANALFAKENFVTSIRIAGDLKHLSYLNTPQWFISMKK